MASFLELNARAALCRRLAKLEPASSHVWLAEAERWSQLAQIQLQAQNRDVAAGLETSREGPDAAPDQVTEAEGSDVSPAGPDPTLRETRTR
jgi:hypothetical protein